MLDELERLALDTDIRFSVYVDDLFFSGATATPSFLWTVKKVIHRHGFRYHAAKCYRPGQPRLVTGAVLNGDRLALRFAEARRIREQMVSLATEAPSEKALKSLQGRLASAKAIDPTYEPWLRTINTQLRALRMDSSNARNTTALP